MNEQRIQEIKDSLREMMELIVQRGEPLTDEIKQMLAQVLEHAAQRIQQLREEEQLEEAEDEQEQVANGVSPPSPPNQPPTPPGEPPPPTNIPPLTPAPHESSNINAFRYEPESQKLFIKFQGQYPQQNGPVYSYEGVPKHIFDVFSRGAVAPRTSGRNAWHTWKEGVTPSHGASMYALIREGGYPYQRLS